MEGSFPITLWRKVEANLSGESSNEHNNISLGLDIKKTVDLSNPQEMKQLIEIYGNKKPTTNYENTCRKYLFVLLKN